jgi:hypothetical protein
MTASSQFPVACPKVIVMMALEECVWWTDGLWPEIQQIESEIRPERRVPLRSGQFPP